MNKLLIIITCLIATSFAGKDCSSCKKDTKKATPISQEIAGLYKKVEALEKEGKKKEALELLKKTSKQIYEKYKIKENKNVITPHERIYPDYPKKDHRNNKLKLNIF